MDTEYKEFLDAANRAVDSLGIEEIAEKYKCSTSFLYQITNGKKDAGRKTQLKIAKACGEETVSDFLKRWGECSEAKDMTNQLLNNLFEIDVVTKNHMELVKKFKNKEIALAINRRLVELEEVNPIAFARAVGDIDIIINDAISKATKQDTTDSSPKAHPQNGGRRNAG